MGRLKKAALLAVVVLAGCSSVHGATATSRDESQPTAGGNLLPATGAAPSGVQARGFAPSGLGASLSMPSSWATGGPESGFRFSAHSSERPFDFILADSHPALASDPTVLARNRTRELSSFSASIESIATGTVAGSPAVRFRYLIGSGSYRAQDVEYDILTGNEVVVIVIGTPPSRPDAPLVDWMASTIKAQ